MHRYVRLRGFDGIGYYSGGAECAGPENDGPQRLQTTTRFKNSSE